METRTDAHGWRTQQNSVRHLRDALYTIGNQDLDGLPSAVALSALDTIDMTWPEYPPSTLLNMPPSLATAKQLVREAIEESVDFAEIGRLGQALQLLSLLDEGNFE